MILCVNQTHFRDFGFNLIQKEITFLGFRFFFASYNLTY